MVFPIWHINIHASSIFSNSNQDQKDVIILIFFFLPPVFLLEVNIYMKILLLLQAIFLLTLFISFLFMMEIELGQGGWIEKRYSCSAIVLLEKNFPCRWGTEAKPRSSKMIMSAFYRMYCQYTLVFSILPKIVLKLSLSVNFFFLLFLPGESAFIYLVLLTTVL